MAEERPLVCLVDDAQWLDRESASALSFVARRLAAEPIAMLFAVRDPSAEQELDGLPELVLEGLGDADARLLLDAAVPGGLDEQVRDRIVAETRGNPLALLELPRGLTPAELAGGFGLPDERGAVEPHRADLPAARAGASAGDPAGSARRSGRGRRRRDGDRARPPAGWESAPPHMVPAEDAGLVELGPARPVPASARAVGRVSGRDAPRAAPGARGTRLGDRSGTRSGPPSLAPRARGSRP